jgi:hypothetical protein
MIKIGIPFTERTSVKSHDKKSETTDKLRTRGSTL